MLNADTLKRDHEMPDTRRGTTLRQTEKAERPIQMRKKSLRRYIQKSSSHITSTIIPP
jgi:hypothetical protein